MKTIYKYITEKLKIRKVTRSYNYKPKTREELIELVKMRMRNEGSDCDLNDIDTSLITDMSRIFAFSAFCGNVSKWDVSNVTNMTSMFNSTYKMTELDLSDWDFSNVEDITTMFNKGSIEHIYLNDTLGESLKKVDGAFMACSNLIELEGISNLINSNNDVKSVGQLFYGCKELKTLDLENWDTSNVEIFDRMFYNNLKLKQVKGIENFNFNNATIISGILYNCKELDADLSNWKLNKANKVKTIEAFTNAEKIKQNMLKK